MKKNSFQSADANNYSKNLNSILNGIANINAADRLAKHQIYQSSIYYYIKGLENIVDFYIKKNCNNKQFDSIKDLIQFYYLKAFEIDKKLNATTKLINLEDLLRDLRQELSQRKQSTKMIINDLKLNTHETDLLGYDSAKEYINSLARDIYSKTHSLKFIRKIKKCRPVLLYSPPGMGKVQFINLTLKDLSVRYEQKLKFNLIKVNFKELSNSQHANNYYDEYFHNILYTIRNYKKQNFILLQDLEFIQNFDDNLVLKLIENFLCEIDSLNGYDTIIIGLTNIPWSLPCYLRYRFYKRFFIPLPHVEHIKQFLKAKLKVKNIFLFNLLNSLDTSKFDVYLEVANCFKNCTFKIINHIFEIFVSKLNESIDIIINANETEESIPASLEATSKTYFFNPNIFKQLIREHVENLVKINKLSEEITRKYELFSKMYDHEIEAIEI